MSALQNSPIDLDIFYKKNDLPKISLGDKVKVTIYLELPKEVAEGEKKRKNVFKFLKASLFQNMYPARKLTRL